MLNDLLTCFERVGDHCSNVAVAMIELESESFDTHEYLNGVKSDKSPEFVQAYEQYKDEFSL